MQSSTGATFGAALVPATAPDQQSTTVPGRRGARRAHRAHRAHSLLVALVGFALCPAFLTPATPATSATPRDLTYMAALVASRDGAALAYRPGGQFTRALTREGLPPFLFPRGLPEYWGSCGGTVAINTSSMSPGELKAVRLAAVDFAATASGPWAITTTTASAGTGSVVVVVVDATIAGTDDLGLAHFTRSFGMQTAAPRFLLNISAATVHLSDKLGGASVAATRSVTLHELGHVAGADHNRSDPRAIMAPELDPGHVGYSGYTTAEKAGIRAGGSHACP